MGAVETSEQVLIEQIDFNLADKIQSLLAPLYERFPELSYTLFGVPVANITAAFGVLFVFLALRKLFARFIVSLFLQLSKHTATQIDDAIIKALKAPASFAIVVIGIHLFVTLLLIQNQTASKVLDSLIIATFFWAVIAVVRSLKDLLTASLSRINTHLAKEMGNFLLKIVTFLILLIGLGAVLKVWGIDITALIASLGLGGLAFALAAKDTAANLFGSLALLADKSIRIGEWIKVGDIEGTVEDIGMRTTKIRTFEKSLVSIPNSTVANTPIENFSRRGVRRIKLTVGLTYDTDAKTLQKITQEIETMLRSHPRISQSETLIVRFNNLGDSALELFVYTFVKGAQWEAYLRVREDVLLKIMQIVQSYSASFAFPSQSLYIEKMAQNS